MADEYPQQSYHYALQHGAPDASEDFAVGMQPPFTSSRGRFASSPTPARQATVTGQHTSQGSAQQSAELSRNSFATDMPVISPPRIPLHDTHANLRPTPIPPTRSSVSDSTTAKPKKRRSLRCHSCQTRYYRTFSCRPHWCEDCTAAEMRLEGGQNDDRDSTFGTRVNSRSASTTAQQINEGTPSTLPPQQTGIHSLRPDTQDKTNEGLDPNNHSARPVHRVPPTISPPFGSQQTESERRLKPDCEESSKRKAFEMIEPSEIDGVPMKAARFDASAYRGPVWASESTIHRAPNTSARLGFTDRLQPDMSFGGPHPPAALYGHATRYPGQADGRGQLPTTHDTGRYLDGMNQREREVEHLFNRLYNEPFDWSSLDPDASFDYQEPFDDTNVVIAGSGNSNEGLEYPANFRFNYK